jgi:hypothetical protein
MVYRGNGGSDDKPSHTETSYMMQMYPTIMTQMYPTIMTQMYPTIMTQPVQIG